MATSSNINKAIKKLYLAKHGEDFVGIVEDGEVIDQTFSGKAMPSQDEIDAEAKKFQDAEDLLEYQVHRIPEYPRRGDQMDMIYHDMKNGTTTHADAIEVVKTKWPKDNSGPVE